MKMHHERGAGLLPFIGLIAVVAIAIGAFVWWWPAGAPGNGTSTSTPETQMITYASSTSGISFRYPSSYILTERVSEGSALRYRFTLILMDRDDAANIPQGGEGPPTITVDIFQNNLDRQSVDAWIRGSNDSNFKLSLEGALATTTIGGVAGRSYTWDGLYRGDSIVLAHRDNIVMFSVTYLSLQDRIRNDFVSILSTVTLN